MVGRSLRGPKFGGTEQAYIVSFIDNWQQSINWAEFNLENGGTEGSNDKVCERLPLNLISIDLVRRLVRQMDSGVNINPAPFLTLMPIGWYRVELETLTEGSENTEIVQRLVMVFEHEKANYENFIEFIENIEDSELEAFVEPNVSFDSQHQQLVQDLQESMFSNFGEHIGGDLLANLFHITRHMAQNDREPPDWFDFEQRQKHNLDDVAQRFIDADLGRRQEDEELRKEYDREDRYWKIIYYSYELFKSQYNACVEWLLSTKPRESNSEFHRSTFTSNSVRPSEPSDGIKEQVKKRDGFRCVCCGTKHQLEIDHINPKYHGGDHSLNNLQTLCRTCNGIKKLETINFFSDRTPLKDQPINLLNLEAPKPKQANDMEEWEQFIRRSINFFYRCTAVKSVKFNQNGSATHSWEICLHTGNNPQWLKQHLEELCDSLRGNLGNQSVNKLSNPI